jgi:hypothetical protein
VLHPHHYDPNQPRVPKGHPDGGRWTDGGRGQDTILQGGQETDGGYRRDTLVQEASLARLVPLLRSLRPVPPAVRDIEAGLRLFALQSAFNSRDRLAVIEFNASEYQRTGISALQFVAARVLTRPEAGDICHKLDDVQKLTNKAVEKVKSRPLPMTPAVYGTFVHTRLRDMINGGEDEDGNKVVREPDENFKAEVSLLKTYDETGARIPKEMRKDYERPYGKKGSIRLDVVENVGNGTVCVYDIKTGHSVLNARRMAEIAGRVFENEKKYAPKVERIIVMEIRPLPGL